ncbi:MAG: sigma-70 family RNA polymerase sigma factor [Verrucomicrobia subdivision 3 bacterium]|nr:sigma-70 family RNA polymerase sigma factor [Limisphaerales bacterium]
MKTIFKRRSRSRTAGLAPPRIRLIPSSLARRRGVSSAPRLPPFPTAREVASAEVISARMPSSDSLQLYLREIGQVTLLTPKEEIALARRITRGDEWAREHMIKANLRLVVKIARDYQGLGLPLLDLISEGNIGLMKGVERFDPKKGAKLSTYASWWINENIRHALGNQSKTIRLPIHVVNKVTQIRRAEMKLRDKLNRDPTDEEVADELQIGLRRVEYYCRASKTPVSLDAPIGGDGSNRFTEVVADPNTAAPFDRVVLETDTELVREVLTTLTARERKILALRYGLTDGAQRTLEEIGENFGVTRERIRQIQEQALNKLRLKMGERDSPSDEKVGALAGALQGPRLR